MRVLLLIDLQNDFCPGGALAVQEGDKVVPIANRLMPRFEMVVATQDWHPADHKSFAANHPGHSPGQVIDLHGLPQVLWPVHCVQESAGAAFHLSLDMVSVQHVFQKGTDPEIDSYSGFFDNGRRKATGLGDFLQAKGATEVYVLGLATDYCVKYSALDALDLGFKTHLVTDACRGVDLQPGDVDKALGEMSSRGVAFVSSSMLL